MPPVGLLAKAAVEPRQVALGCWAAGVHERLAAWHARVGASSYAIYRRHVVAWGVGRAASASQLSRLSVPHAEHGLAREAAQQQGGASSEVILPRKYCHGNAAEEHAKASQAHRQGR